MPTINRPTYTDLLIFTFVLFYSIASSFLKISLLCDSLPTSWNLFLSVVTSLMFLYFLTLPIVFPKTKLFISLKKSFSESFLDFVLSLVFISTYGFSYASRLNSSTFCNFSSITQWFNDFFRVSVCITHNSTRTFLTLTNFQFFG